MHYKNGEVILPAELLLQIQKYVQGEMLYIPCMSSVRAKWGEASGAKAMLKARDEAIYSKYMEGMTHKQLSALYFLSEDRIRKILSKQRREQL